MLISCHECGHNVSTEARACPSCGAPPREDKSNTQPSTPAENVKLVKPYDALYYVWCKSCGNAVQITDSCLGASNINCPYDGAQINLRKKGHHIEMAPGIGVLYRRFGDLFSYEGRVGVGGYWTVALILLPLFVVLRSIHPFLYALAFIIFLHPLWVKRLHDHGWNGAWVMFPIVTSLLIIVTMPIVQSGGSDPILGILLGVSMLVTMVLGIIIAFCPGNKKINRYGPPPSQMVIRW